MSAESSEVCSSPIYKFGQISDVATFRDTSYNRLIQTCLEKKNNVKNEEMWQTRNEGRNDQLSLLHRETCTLEELC